MRPKTKKQHEVFELSKTVAKIDKDIESWALDECNDHIAFATKNRYWCTRCGAEHRVPVGRRKTIKCPDCNTKLQVKKNLKRTFEQQYYVGYAEILGDYQVIRLFRITSGHAKGRKPWICAYETIMQFYPENHDRVEYIARTRNMGQGYPTGGNLEIRMPGGYNDYLYNPCQWKFHPASSFKPEYAKYGIDHKLQGLSFRLACRAVWHSSKAETILKSRQFSLFTACSERMHKIDKYWASIKIAIRHKYMVTDASVWLDHLDLLSEAGKDLRNPKFICSPTLFRDHHRMIAKRRKEQERLAKIREREFEIRRREQDKKEMQESLARFLELKQHFFGLQFSKGNILVKVLESIEEYKAEGDAFGHCVYTNKYYTKESTLVMSASVNGVRTETVEINLQSMSIIQSRGKYNKSTKHNEEIVELVNKNMYQIAQRMQGEQKNAG